MSELVEKYTIPFSDLNLTLSDLASKSRSRLSDIQTSCADLLDRAEKETKILAETRMVSFRVDFKTATAFIDGQAFYVGDKLAKKMRRANLCVIFTCTAGDNLHQIAQQSNLAQDYLKGYYYDLFGTMIVEKSVQLLCAKMKKRHKIEHLSHSNKYGPGYCDWCVSDQKALLDFIDNDHVNISLSEHSLMSPIKTLTGIWAVGEQVKFLKDTCEYCESKTCLYRQA